MAPPNHIQITIPSDNVEAVFDYSKRAERHRANDGFVSVASLMMGTGSVGDEGKALYLTFFAGLFGSGCSMAIGEFVSMLDIDIEKRRNDEDVAEERLFNRSQATLASALVFAAAFMTDYSTRLVAATTMALVALGGIVAVWRCVRMVVGGWMAMAITFGVTKLSGNVTANLVTLSCDCEV